MTIGWDDTELDDLIDPHEVPVPGSRPRVKHVEKEETKTEKDWDASPRVYRVNGEDTELFPISAFLMATGFKFPTVRKWERDGVLPVVLLRSPRKDGAKGHRLYSRAFIEGVARIAQEEKLAQNRMRPGGTNFAARVAQLFRSTGG